MRPVSAAWADAIIRPHALAVRAVLLDDGVETELATPAAGAVTLDAKAAVRGRLDLTIVDDGSLGLVPSSAADPLAPYGNEVRVERGISYPDGTDELVALGVFRIEDLDVDDAAGAMHVRITGLDRAQRIADARFEEAYQVAAGTNYATAILDAIQPAYPELESELTSTTRTTPVLIAEEGADRWEFCQQMATAIGMDLYFDGDGVLVLRPGSQAGAGAAVVDLVEGEEGVLVSAARRWTRQGAFNRVIATGENTGETAPARAVATDEDINSPTYYNGQFGKVPRFYVSQFITTDAQAGDAARAILARELGTTQQVTFGSVVNPALEPGDIARITRARAGIDEDHIIDSLTIPLDAGTAMSGATRATQVS